MSVNVVDLILIILVVVAIFGGLRAGLITRAFTWVGFAIGVVLATRTVPFALSVVGNGSPTLRFVLAVTVLALTVSLTGALLGSLGRRLRHGLGGEVLPRIDRVAGGVVGAVLVVVIAWLLLPAAADVPGGVAREVRGSTISQAIRSVAPPPPDAARGLRALVGSTRFPEVLSDLAQTPTIDDPPAAVEVSDEVVDRVTAATSRVSARGCDRRYEGSAVAVAPDTVLTNAHVVAGADEVHVTRPDGVRRDGRVIAFDPARDLAVIEASDLGQEPLPLGNAEVGADGVSIGYPGGIDQPRVAPLNIAEQRTALGRDIYGDAETERQVLFLAADLEQGDSGSPVVDADGEIVGLVFAVSPDRPSTAFALDRDELDAILAAERVTGATGPCID